MRFQYLVLVLLLGICFSSCKKELPFPGVDAEQLLVINSLFTADDLMQVHVSESCHVNEEYCESKFILNADVRIMDEQGNVLVNLAHQGNGIYQDNSFSLDYQSNYEIEVNHSGQSAKANGRVPKAFSCAFIDREEGVFNGAPAWRFDIEINDDPDEDNFYLLEGYIDILDGEHGYGESELNGYVEPHSAHLTNDINSENQTIASGFDISTYSLRSVFLTDENFNGQTYQTHFAIRDEEIYFPEFEEFEAHLFIKSVTKEMYDYYKSLEKYRLSQSNLFSEPEQIYSNIENGVGIFAGYTQQEFIIDLPLSVYRLPSGILVENNDCSGPCTILFSTDGGSKVNYFWDFGDDNTSTAANPEHKFESAGMYIVDLSIVTSPGNISTFTAEVNIK